MVVSVALGSQTVARQASDADETVALAQSAGAQVVGLIQGRRERPDPAYFVGTGKAEEVRLRCLSDRIELVVFDHELSPAQQRNLSRVLGVRVLDRVQLILDIFALRASSHEGKLQVELAQLDYLSARLVRGWTHLERQKGGIGLRGPGETQLETDRRLIGQRVKQLKQRLASISKQRQNRRRARIRSGTLDVSLVGYTNAGKSTLFNALTRAGVYAADQLFATLDTTSRRVFLGPDRFMVLSDTVGFIQSLPHTLVEAFQSTLQEAVQADLLLHVIDAADADRLARQDAVESVLAEIGAAEVPRIEVFNKIDAVGLAPRVERDPHGRIARVWLSAGQGLGLGLLRQAIEEFGWAQAGPVGTTDAARSPMLQTALYNSLT
ncbi:MAG: GTPase HflX [Betaproteobacteria bacterium]|nr:GTPase HflX [Betaproteobacteria bacterium]